jgi:hypothetical protein
MRKESGGKIPLIISVRIENYEEGKWRKCVTCYRCKTVGRR